MSAEKDPKAVVEPLAARLKPEQVATYVGCFPHDIPILVRAGLLKRRDLGMRSIRPWRPRRRPVCDGHEGHYRRRRRPHIYAKQGNHGSDRPRITKPLRLFNRGDTGLARIGQP